MKTAKTGKTTQQDIDFEFGVCPLCLKTDGYINIGYDHWRVCGEHKVRWYIGSNLFSSAMYETEQEKREDLAIARSFRIVKAVYGTTNQAGIQSCRGELSVKKKISKTALQSYVVEYGDGSVRKTHGVVDIIRAESKRAADAALDAECEKNGTVRVNGDVRIAGDEPRIQAIVNYAKAQYHLGQLDREISDLNDKRDALAKEAEHFRDASLALPDDPSEEIDIPF